MVAVFETMTAAQKLREIPKAQKKLESFLIVSARRVKFPVTCSKRTTETSSNRQSIDGLASLFFS
jgi:hypothetical protein